MTVAPMTRRNLISTWSAERGIVVAIGLLWLVLIFPVPRSLDGLGTIIALTLLALNIALGILTRWLAFTPTWNLDERVTVIRDQAYRSAFHLMRGAVVVMLILAVVNNGISGLEGAPSPDGVSLRFLLALVALLAVLPSAVLAWQQGTPHDAVDRGPIAPNRWLLLLVAPLLMVVWLALEPTLPARTILTRPTNTSFDLTGATCSQFLVEKEVAAGLAGAVGFHAEVCWNGQKAFAVGDPSFPLPAGVLPHQEAMPLGGLNYPLLTACTAGNAENDFATNSETCRQQIDDAGTMGLIAHGRVSPLPGGYGSRALSIGLVVSRDGKVLGVD